MNKDVAIDLLVKRWPNADALRAEFPGLTYWLAGEFDDGPCNDYVQGNGIVVSRKLVQTPSLVKDPTVGLIMPGKYQFNTGAFTENLIVLEGRLVAGVGIEIPSSFSKRTSIIAPPESDLHLQANGRVFYVCHYHPK